MKKRISFFLKAAAVILSFSGVILSFVFAKADGYSHWTKRLFYFTSQSNLWIGLTLLALLLLPYVKALSDNIRVKNILYILRYVFTVSITVTGFIFCAVLAPGASNDNYNAFTVSSLITHVLVPVISVVDFFVDEYRIRLKKRYICYTVLPPLAYVIFASILSALNVDFGRGDSFPYFFLNYSSPAGIFGTSEQMPYVIGSFYWIVFILFIIIGLGALYRIIYNRKK